jgi:PII-like signaling protein
MNMVMVRVYIMEAEKQLQPILTYLHDTIKVKGVTVFRAITGFGKSGAMHSSTLVDLSLNLPIAVEFYDSAEQVAEIIEHLNTFIEQGHIVSWPIAVNITHDT